MSKDTALVIIDVQVGLIEPAYKGNEVLDHIIRVKPTEEVAF